MKQFKAFRYFTLFGGNGWSDFKLYNLSSKQECLDDIKKLEDRGYFVDNYIYN